MLDFQKSELPSYFKEDLLSNSLLDFRTVLNERTGEIGQKSTAYFNDMKFTIYDNHSENTRITLEGSFHKYWNNGEHNFNDFNTEALQWVLGDIELKFNIRPSDCNIKQLEVGLNFHPPYTTKKILESCLMHKTTGFKWCYVSDEGNYIQAIHKCYIVKIYDKQKHYANKGYKIPFEIMRFELKFKRQQLNTILNKEGVITLEEIIDFGVVNFKPVLLGEWDNVLFYDFTTLGSNYNKEKYSNPFFWIQLKKSNFKYHRNKLNKIISENPLNLKIQITEIMREKINVLNKETV